MDPYIIVSFLASARNVGFDVSPYAVLMEYYTQFNINLRRGRPLGESLETTLSRVVNHPSLDIDYLLKMYLNTIFATQLRRVSESDDTVKVPSGWHNMILTHPDPKVRSILVFLIPPIWVDSKIKVKDGLSFDFCKKIVEFDVLINKYISKTYSRVQHQDVDVQSYVVSSSYPTNQPRKQMFSNGILNLLHYDDILSNNNCLNSFVTPLKKEEIKTHCHNLGIESSQLPHLPSDDVCKKCFDLTGDTKGLSMVRLDYTGHQKDWIIRTIN